MELKYMVAADFGQMNDFTAVAVIERRFVKSGERYRQMERWADYPTGAVQSRFEMRAPVEQHYDLIRLDRVPLRTPYTKIAAGLVDILKQLYNKQHKEMQENPVPYEIPGEFPDQITVGLAIDEGGVGKAVRDILIKEAEERLAYGEPHIHFLPTTIHGGANTTHSQGFWHVPKRDLISAGLLCYQNGKLRVGNLEHRATLEEELANFRLKQNISTSHVAFEPLREGQHDDLLFAVCLGCWAWERATKKPEYLIYPGALAY